MSDFNRTKHIKMRKDKIKKIRENIKSGKIKTGKKDKPVEESIINPDVLRNQLVVEYNRLIREGNPDTKELREQIHAQIQEIEEAESHVTG